jgi:hypothetical protein
MGTVINVTFIGIYDPFVPVTHVWAGTMSVTNGYERNQILPLSAKLGFSTAQSICHRLRYIVIPELKAAGKSYSYILFDVAVEDNYRKTTHTVDDTIAAIEEFLAAYDDKPRNDKPE